MPALLFETFHNHHPQFEFQDSILGRLQQNLESDPRRILILSIPEFVQLSVWGESKELVLHKIDIAIQRYKPNAIVMTSLAEPHWEGSHTYIYNKIIKSYNIPCYFFGNYRGDNCETFSFALPYFKVHFADYNNNELMPRCSDKFFMNLNRVPRPHRVRFCNLLREHQLLESGHVSLGLVADPILLPESDETLVQEIKHRSRPLVCFTNLGNLALWSDTVVHVVSESDWKTDEVMLGNINVSEKTLKPIAGLRPFLINGSYDNLVLMLEQGFDLYFDAFGCSLEDFSTMEKAQNTIIKSLLDLKSQTAEQRLQWYHNLMPRILANKQRLNEVIDAQWQILDSYKLPR